MGDNHQWFEELAILRSIIEQTPLVKTIKWGTEVYTYQGKNVVTLIGFKQHLALWFTDGVLLKDKDKHLVSASEGKTKAQRQWRFKSKADIPEKKVLSYLQEAIKYVEQDITIKPEPFKPVIMPVILKDSLRLDKQLNNAFNQLTPGKQKEFMLYLSEAKRDNTRQTRLEKIKPLILRGEGLHDKYR